MRRVKELVDNGGNGDMYRGWSPNQAELRRSITEEGLYPEPYTRTAGVSDEQNAWLLKRVMELFGSLDDNRRDGFKDVQAQQNAGNDAADVTKDVPGKYRTPYQQQISGVGFESLERNIRDTVVTLARSLAAEMRKEEKDAEEKERREKDERERREKDEKDRKDREEKEKKEREEKDKSAREEKDDEIKKLSAQLESLTAEISTIRSQFSNPIGSRTMQGQAAPANMNGVLQPAGFNPTNTESTRALSLFVDKGKVLLAKENGPNGDPARLARLRSDLSDAMLNYKSGSVPNITDPELQSFATELGLPHGLDWGSKAPQNGNGGVAN